MRDDLTIDRRRKDVALEATYQLEALLQAMMDVTAGTERDVAMRAFGIRATHLNAFLMSWLGDDIPDDEIGSREIAVFGALQGAPEGNCAHAEQTAADGVVGRVVNGGEEAASAAQASTIDGARAMAAQDGERVPPLLKEKAPAELPASDNADQHGDLRRHLSAHRALLDSALALAEKESSWTNPEDDPVVHLISTASADFEPDLMPEIKAICKGASAVKGSVEARHK